MQRLHTASLHLLHLTTFSPIYVPVKIQNVFFLFDCRHAYVCTNWIEDMAILRQQSAAMNVYGGWRHFIIIIILFIRSWQTATNYKKLIDNSLFRHFKSRLQHMIYHCHVLVCFLQLTQWRMYYVQCSPPFLWFYSETHLVFRMNVRSIKRFKDKLVTIVFTN